MKKGLLIIISGPSGSGKGTVLAHIIKDKEHFYYSVSATTRKMRPNDVDGVTYLFISREEFEKKIARGEMLEYAEYVGNLYGTPQEPIDKALDAGKNVILEIETQGALKVMAKRPDAISIMLVPPDAKTLRDRLSKRETENEETIARRLKQAEFELSHFNDYDYVVINRDNADEDAAKEILGIIKAEAAKTSRNGDVKENYFT
ncbi:MAG: guanylate kinase [Clostridia bacterium]|nr:guanylate kinase [Clostridia bacterium]MBO4428875.1 guanylate kinase [Clostridia bacterium]